MKNFRVVVILSLLSVAMNLFSSVHEERMKLRRDLFHVRIMQRNEHEQVRQHATSIKALVCMCLLLTPVSWKHVVTIPQQLQLPEISHETNIEVFERIAQRNGCAVPVEKDPRSFNRPIIKNPSHR